MQFISFLFFRWPAFILLLILPFLVYFPALHYEFVWDDQSFLVDNKSILEETSWAVQFTDQNAQAETPEAQIYRPIRNLCYRMEYCLFGLSPFWFHFNNLLLHGFNGALLFLLARFCFHITPGRAWILSLFFLFHPLQTEVVCWVKSRDDLLAVFFGALAFACFHLYIQAPRLMRLFPFLLFYLLSLFSKESSLFLFGVFFLWALHKNKLLPFQQKLSLFILLALPPITYLFLRFRTLGQWGQDSVNLAGSFLKTQLGMALVYRDYLFKILFPWNQRVNYMGYDPFSLEGIPTLIFYALFLLLLLGWLFLRGTKEEKIRLSFFLLAFLPIANWVPMMQWEAERFLYFPLFFFALFLEKVFPEFKSTATKKTALLLTLIPLILYGIQTTQREKVWKNNQTLGISMLKSNPYSYHGLVLVLDYNRRHEWHQENIQLASEYLKKFPNELFIYDYLSFALIQIGALGQARETILKGLAVFPRAPLLLKFKHFLEVPPTNHETNAGGKIHSRLKFSECETFPD